VSDDYGETPAEIGWRSTPNLKCLQQVTSDIREPEPSENRDSKGWLEGRPCVSMPNIVVRPSLAGDAPDLGLPSDPSCKTELPVSNVTQKSKH